MNKKLILSWGVFAVVVIVAACLFFITKKPEEAPEYVLFYAENQTADYPTTLGAQRFAELVQERTGGRIHIIVESEAKLGAESEVLEQIKYGGIAFARVSLSQIAEQAPEMNVLQLPYLYRDSEHMWRVLDGEIGEEFLQKVSAYGYIGLSWYDAGARSFYSVEKPITCLEDFQGMTIRVQESDMMADMVEALGAKAVKIVYSSVYSALQRHTIDGAENNWPSYEAMNHYEVAPYFTVDEHTRVPEIQICSASIWEQLSDEDREILRECARESAEYERVLWKDREEQSRQTAIANGTCVSTLSAEEKERFRNAMSNLYETYCADSAELIQKIMEQ